MTTATPQSKKKHAPSIQPLFDTLDHFSNYIKHNHLPCLNDKNLDAVQTYKKDYKQAVEFLYSYRGSKATFNAYRRELERFLQWSWFIKKQSIATLSKRDIESFITFCQNPPQHWIGSQHNPRFIEAAGQRQPNPAWRPFVLTAAQQTQAIHNNLLSQNALQAIFSILSSFYTYLGQENYVDVNPVIQMRQKSKFIRKKQHHVVRRLTPRQWEYVITTAKKMAEENPEKHERTLFIMSALYSLYLRISELVATERFTPQMGHFHQDYDGHWWFLTVGKGNKERLISVSNAMLQALQRYRQYLGLPPLPTLGETLPLIMRQRGKGPVTSTRNIRFIVQHCFDEAVHALNVDGFHEEAQQLQAATVHWLRHTGISDDVIYRPREHVRDDAGHSSGAITDRYIDITAKERHASKRKRKITTEMTEEHP